METSPRLTKETFERLREQIATASALCSDEQLLELADGMHETIRRHRQTRRPGPREPQSMRNRLCLSANWPKWLTAATIEQRSFRT